MEIQSDIQRFIAQVRDQIEGVPTVYRDDVLEFVGEALPKLLELRVDFLRSFRMKRVLDETEGPITPEQMRYQGDISHVFGTGYVVSPRRPVTSAPCPVCTSDIRSDECEGLLYCTRCYAAYHEACFWRVLPIEDFLAYWAWLKRPDDEHGDEHRDYVCATCRHASGA